MSDIKKTQGIYCGEEFLGKGEKNGKAWSRWKRMFKPSMESDKKFSFTFFKKDGVEDKALEVGQPYTISYTEQPNPQSPDHPYKTAIGFFPGAAATAPQQKKLSVDAPKEKVLSSITIGEDLQTQINKLPNWEEFQKLYVENVEAKYWTRNHIIGTYLSSYFSEKIKRLLDQSKIMEKAINTK